MLYQDTFGLGNPHLLLDKMIGFVWDAKELARDQATERSSRH